MNDMQDKNFTTGSHMVNIEFGWHDTGLKERQDAMNWFYVSGPLTTETVLQCLDIADTMEAMNPGERIQTCMEAMMDHFKNRGIDCFSYLELVKNTAFGGVVSPEPLEGHVHLTISPVGKTIGMGFYTYCPFCKHGSHEEIVKKWNENAFSVQEQVNKFREHYKHDKQ